ncbi:recombinase family protein [Vibrio fluvialis]|nr:recombinase family protein [Vibrio fluvialis]
MKQHLPSIESIVIYKRLSTKRERQQSSFATQDDYNRLFINQYADSAKVLAEFEEEQSGSDNNRPMLHKAIKLCQETGSTLLVAKIDRLGRDVELIASVIKKVSVRVAVMPFADNFSIHIYAALAEQELVMIRQRVRDGVRKAIARGKKPGHPNAKQHMAETVQPKGTEAVVCKADEFAEAMRKTLTNFVKARMTLSDMRHALNDMHITTQRGKAWTETGVRNVLKRLELPTSSRTAT